MGLLKYLPAGYKIFRGSTSGVSLGTEAIVGLLAAALAALICESFIYTANAESSADSLSSFSRLSVVSCPSNADICVVDNCLSIATLSIAAASEFNSSVLAAASELMPVEVDCLVAVSLSADEIDLGNVLVSESVS